MYKASEGIIFGDNFMLYSARNASFIYYKRSLINNFLPSNGSLYNFSPVSFPGSRFSRTFIVGNTEVLSIHFFMLQSEIIS